MVYLGPLKSDKNPTEKSRTYRTGSHLEIARLEMQVRRLMSDIARQRRSAQARTWGTILLVTPLMIAIAWSWINGKPVNDWSLQLFFHTAVISAIVWAVRHATRPVGGPYEYS